MWDERWDNKSGITQIGMKSAIDRITFKTASVTSEKTESDWMNALQTSFHSSSLISTHYFVTRESREWRDFKTDIRSWNTFNESSHRNWGRFWNATSRADFWLNNSLIFIQRTLRITSPQRSNKFENTSPEFGTFFFIQDRTCSISFHWCRQAHCVSK